MKALFLFGSPKRNSHTAALCGAFLQGLSKDYAVEIVRLFDLMPKPCNDCGYCKASDGCSKKDLDSLMESYFDADLVVVASPVYLLSYPAPVKALFDRFQRFYNARFRRGIAKPIVKPKKAVLLLSAGDDGKEAQTVIEAQTRRAFSVMNTEIVGTVLADNTDSAPVSREILQRAFSLAKSL
ncbi:MAG: flavodoxin family protein [Candidatus Fimenecus sp.]